MSEETKPENCSRCKFLSVSTNNINCMNTDALRHPDAQKFRNIQVRQKWCPLDINSNDAYAFADNFCR